MAGTLSAKLLSLAALMVLARLITPADLGLFAFALLYLTYVETISDLGMGMALVYWPDHRSDAAQVCFAVNVVGGAVLTAATLLTAPAVAAFFRHPEAEPVLCALAWTFVIKGCGNTHDALLRKDLRFKQRLVPEVGLASVKAALAVILALAGFGAWSLVWAQLAGVAAWSALLWFIVPWRPSLRWPADLFHPMLRYSAGIVAINLMAAVTHHADAVIVGRVLGAAALGTYQIAYRLPEFAVALLVWQASRVLFPAFARARADRRDLGQAYLDAVRYLALITGPLAVTLFILAEPLILTLFGPSWVAAVPIVRALSVYAGIRAIGSPTGDVLKAAGRPGLLAALGVVKAIILIPALLLAARSSATAIACAMAFVSLFTLGLNLMTIRRFERVPLAGLAAALRPGAIVSGAVAAVLVCWTALSPWSAGPLDLAVAGCLATGVAALTLRTGCPDIAARLRDTLRPTIGPRRAPAPAAVGAEVGS